MNDVQYADAAGRYRLDSRIATGGMGVVWRATDTRLGREVAVKVLKEEFADDPTFRTRFDAEARNAAALHHANIAGVFDYDADPTDRAPFLVMELVDGKPLSMLIGQAKADGESFDPDVVRDLLGQAADGLAVAHRAGIVHRDVKPANLMVTPSGQVKVTDFGIARAADGVQITHTGSVMGTPQYLSPEQARGEPATPASDVYSLGVVAFECLAGRRPFEAESPVATTLAHIQQPVPPLPDSVPPDLAAVVTRALAKDPAARYADAAGFAAALHDPAGAGAAGAGAAGTGAAGTAATEVLPTTGRHAAPVPAPVPAPATSTGPMDRLSQPTAYSPGEPAPEQSRKKSSPWPVLLLVLLVLAVFALVGWLVFGGKDEETTASDETSQTATEPSTTATSEETTEETTEATTTAPATVTIDPNDYLGRPVADVEAELKNLGLKVTLNEEANDGTQTEDAVSQVNPSGTVAEGTLITVSYYGAPTTTPTTPTTEPTDETSTATTPPEGEDG